jgi:RNase P subunit RPR2
MDTAGGRRGPKRSFKGMGLDTCPDCASHLVQSARREPTASPSGVRMWRYCPECGWHGDGVYERRQLLVFDRTQDDGLAVLIRAARQLERESMRDFVEVFTTALQRGVIAADDFERPAR